MINNVLVNDGDNSSMWMKSWSDLQKHICKSIMVSLATLPHSYALYCIMLVGIIFVIIHVCSNNKYIPTLAFAFFVFMTSGI